MVSSDLTWQRLRLAGAAANRRIRHERWLLDAARSTRQAKRARLALEQIRIRRLIGRTGSADAALDQIVADALQTANSDRGS